MDCALGRYGPVANLHGFYAMYRMRPRFSAQDKTLPFNKVFERELQELGLLPTADEKRKARRRVAGGNTAAQWEAWADAATVTG